MQRRKAVHQLLMHSLSFCLPDNDMEWMHPCRTSCSISKGLSQQSLPLKSSLVINLHECLSDQYLLPAESKPILPYTLPGDSLRDQICLIVPFIDLPQRFPHSVG